MCRRGWDGPQYAVRLAALTPGRRARHDPPMRDDADDDRIDAREAARLRRRDRDADARGHDLMRPGMGKVFKQIQDSWGRKAPSRVPKPRTTPPDKP